MDPIQALFADLRSPDPDIRFSVLNRMEDFPWTAEQRAALRESMAAEFDPGIRFQMEKILMRVEGIHGEAQQKAPTAQDVAELLHNPQRDEITLALEMLVRAYDPCISCSTHILKVSFVNC